MAKRKTASYQATEKPSPYWIKIKSPRYSQAEGRDELFERAESRTIAIQNNGDREDARRMAVVEALTKPKAEWLKRRG